MTQPDTWTSKEADRLGAMGRGECTHETTVDVTVLGGIVEKVYCLSCRQEVEK